MKSKQRKIKEYSKIIKNDFDFDYYYLLKLEQFKIKRMLKYWTLYSHLKNSHIIIGYFKICIKLIDIILEENSEKTYINSSNLKRFMKNVNIDKTKDILKPYVLEKLRAEKAMYLYNKIRAYTMLTWWD